MCFACFTGRVYVRTYTQADRHCTPGKKPSASKEERKRNERKRDGEEQEGGGRDWHTHSSFMMKKVDNFGKNEQRRGGIEHELLAFGIISEFLLLL